MRVYDILDEQGRVFAFEVNNFLLGRKRVCSMLLKIPGVRMIRVSKSASRLDEFCEFEIEGQSFQIWEPWGDSSRFWIGPRSKHWCPQVSIVRGFFVARRRLF